MDSTAEQGSPSANQAAANEALRKLFGVPEDSQLIIPDFEPDLLYGKSPDKLTVFQSGNREFRAEIYFPEKGERNVWAVAQHGYGGRARDFSKLAELLNRDGIGVFSVDMHFQGEDKFERMSMIAGEWARVAMSAKRVLNHECPPHQRSGTIFIGQSSGGTAGGQLIELDNQPYDGALLIGPTLVTPDPDSVVQMDKAVEPFTRKGADFMIDWKWLGLVSNQMHDEALNKAYLSYLASTAGMPYFAARGAYVVPREQFMDWIHDVKVPTFVTRGEFDTEDTTSLEILREELLQKPNPSFTIKPLISDAGHQAHIEKPDEVAKLVRELIKEI